MPTLTTPPSSSDPTTFDARGDAFLGELPAFEVEMLAVGAQATADAATASAASASAAANATIASNAASAAAASATTQTTSATSLTITNGASRTFLGVSGSLTLVKGMYMLAASSANPDTYWMSGRVLSYSGTTLVVSMDNAYVANLGAARADWVISLAVAGGRPSAVPADVYAATAGVSLDPATLIAGTAPQSVTYASTIAWDVATKGYSIKATLTGDIVIGAPSVLRDGMTYRIKLKQDGAGGHAPTFNAIYNWGDAGVPDVNTGANVVSIFAGDYDADDGVIYMNHRRGA
ncbi:hypothetical protein [Phenylobacterium sp.]|uniref:hypothetical protein n=1 Tax=Phenylobacterium sp. TaxID=1871053 RepID=UPI002F407455